MPGAQAEQFDKRTYRGTEQSILRVLTCGSVDDGKSTLLGRLLFDCDALPDDALDTLRRDSKAIGKAGEKVDFSLLADGLLAEREQGITIDVAYRYFATTKRKFIVADAPGHEQYTRNMVTGASVSDVAIVLIDARNGLLRQTKRHACIVSLMGIKNVVVAINKMDLVSYDEVTFNAIQQAFRSFADSLGGLEVSVIPVVAVDGDNIVGRSEAMTWYKGPTLIEFLESTQGTASDAAQSLRLPVQWICRPHLDFRGYGGTVVAGQAAPGDEIVVAPSGSRSRIREISTSQGTSTALRGDAVLVTLEDELDIGRGAMICSASDPIETADRLSTKIVWLGEQPMLRGRSYIFRMGPQSALAQIGACKHKIDVNDLSKAPGNNLTLNDIGECELALDRHIAFEPYSSSRENGGFILIDRLTNETVGAGMIQFALRRSHNIHWQHVDLNKRARADLKQQGPCCLWFTGLSGAGKSTIANALERRLYDLGAHTYLLDGDNVRHGLCRDLGFTAADRVENIRRVAEVAKLMVDAGLVALVSFISPFRAERMSARELFEPGEFLELFVDAPLQVCEARDPKGLYRKARQGSIQNFTGIDQPYEPPTTPEMRLDTSSTSVDALVEQIVANLLERRIISRS